MLDHIRTVVLPEHERASDTQTCCECFGTMHPITMNRTMTRYKRKFRIEGINGYTCENCGASVYTAAEGKFIEASLAKQKSRRKYTRRKQKPNRDTCPSFIPAPDFEHELTQLT